MSQKDLEDAGILLPKNLWGRNQFGSTVNVFALIVAGVLGLGSGALIYLGDGSWLTWVGSFGYFIFLGFFLFISIRAIEKQNDRLELLMEKAEKSAGKNTSRKDQEKTMSKKVQVIVADEDDAIQNLFMETLQSKEIELQVVASGEDLQNKLKHTECDILFLDLHLPDANGIDLLKTISKDYSGIQVCMISGRADIREAVTAIKFGAADFLEKPLQPELISETVEKFSARKSLKESEAKSYEDYIHLAKKQLHAGNYNETITLANRAMELDAERPEAYNILGMVHEFRGEKEEAQNQYRTALAKDPSYQPASVNLDHITQK